MSGLLTDDVALSIMRANEDELVHGGAAFHVPFWEDEAPMRDVEGLLVSATLNQRKRSDQLRQAETRLSQLLTQEGVERWLGSAKDFLNGATPRQAIGQGNGDAVLESIARLEWGHYV